MKEVQYRFVDWLCDPNREGDQGSWAKANDVHEVTVSRWKRNSHFIDAWYDRLRELDVAPEKVQEVTVALQRKAADGDMKAAKLYLDYVAQFTPQREVVAESKALASMTDAELDALLAQAATDERSRRADVSDDPDPLNEPF